MNTFMGPMAPPQAAQQQPPQMDVRTSPMQRQQFRDMMRGMSMPQALPNIGMGVSPEQPNNSPMPLSPLANIDIFEPVQSYSYGGRVDALSDILNQPKPVMSFFAGGGVPGNEDGTVGHSSEGVSASGSSSGTGADGGVDTGNQVTNSMTTPEMEEAMGIMFGDDVAAPAPTNPDGFTEAQQSAIAQATVMGDVLSPSQIDVVDAVVNSQSGIVQAINNMLSNPIANPTVMNMLATNPEIDEDGNVIGTVTSSTGQSGTVQMGPFGVTYSGPSMAPGTASAFGNLAESNPDSQVGRDFIDPVAVDDPVDINPCPAGYQLKDGRCVPVAVAEPSAPMQPQTPVPTVVQSTRDPIAAVPFRPVSYNPLDTNAFFQNLLGPNLFNPVAMQDGGSVLDAAADKFLEALTS